jgi:hypothetical protein
VEDDIVIVASLCERSEVLAGLDSSILVLWSLRRRVGVLVAHLGRMGVVELDRESTLPGVSNN